MNSLPILSPRGILPAGAGLIALACTLAACSSPSTEEAAPETHAEAAATTSSAAESSEHPRPKSTVTVTVTAEQTSPAAVLPSGVVPSVGDCSAAALQHLNPDMTSLNVMACDGQWAHYGQNATDWTQWARFSQGQWQRIPSIGTTQTGMAQPCYDVAGLSQQGRPGFMAATMPSC
ncbi:MAG: hypothetical protein L0L28_07075 [Corynebacterium flavescens]|uniref:hypothetical protein n=1 Tax=Corynebacterium flavescens TaxID=28028 RepID=UPI00264957E0|nr:hypothetical protein [Corynebacterium flavescens]MDN6552515.1 hypothetical protein [Corynebacterium flavescens]